MPAGDIVHEILDKPILKIKANMMNFGDNKVELILEPIGLPEEALNASSTVRIRHSSLVAIIAGGSLKTAPEGTVLVLDASSSTDPDSDTDSHLSYAWDCRTADVDQNVVAVKYESCLRDQFADEVFPDKNTLRIDSNRLRPSGAYYVNVTVSTDSRQATASQTVVIVSQEAPQITLRSVLMRKMLNHF